jgi:ubiquinone/menaquinone biosynthesis C-methylase UbiE
MSLKHSYSLLAPIYDAIVASASLSARRKSLAKLGDVSNQDILLVGVGTGLDIPLLDTSARYIGTDLTPNMLKRAQQRADAICAASSLNIQLQEGNAMQMDFTAQCFDHVVLHLILAVVPEPGKVLAEAIRVVKPGGKILIYDKFLRPNQTAPLRRLLSPITGKLFSRIDVEFEQVLSQFNNVELMEDEPSLAGGWFRHILLRKIA